MNIVAVGRSFPTNYASQEQLIAAFAKVWAGRYHNTARIEQLHRAVQVGGRHLALPIDAYDDLHSFGDSNDVFIRVATEIGEVAIDDALQQAGLGRRDIDALWFTSVTGIAAPSIDARLVNRMGLRPDVKRVPIFGLGCVAGAAGIARLADYSRAFPEHVAVLLSVELCSLTVQREDLSIPNLIATGLFGDGAAAAIVTGRPLAVTGPKVLATKSCFYPDTQDVMGWRIGASGFQIVLSAEVPEMVRRYLRHDVEGFLTEQSLTQADITTWVAHPGGPKVLQVMEEVFGLPRSALQKTWDSLAAVGNLSSASVLHVLAETLADPPPPGSYGMMVAMGPGFCSELVLLRW